jgi:hypothetical protein
MEHELTRKRTGRLTQIRVTSVVGGQYLSVASFIRVHSCPCAVLIRLRVLVVKIWGQGLAPGLSLLQLATKSTDFLQVFKKIHVRHTEDPIVHQGRSSQR